MVDDRADGVLDALLLTVADLELKWSRFEPASEISRCNAAAGSPVVVSPETADLIARARDAHHGTGGWFDPLMLNDILRAGYNTSFELVGAFGGGRRALAGPLEGPAPADRAHFERPSMTDVDVDPVSGLVQFPLGAAFDPGGIGKGRAADVVAARARQNGARWVIVDLGGDVRVDGEELPFGDFHIDVAHPDGGTVARLAMTSGAAATSGTGRRRWHGPDGEARHHLLDPRTGAPAVTDLRSVTVLAAEAWWAEAVATATVVAGHQRGLELLERLQLPALVVDGDDHITLTGDIEEFLL